MDLSTVGEVDLWISRNLDLDGSDRTGARLNLHACPICVIFGEPSGCNRETTTPNGHMSDSKSISGHESAAGDLSIHPQPVDNSPFAQLSTGLGKTRLGTRFGHTPGPVRASSKVIENDQPSPRPSRQRDSQSAALLNSASEVPGRTSAGTLSARG